MPKYKFYYDETEHSRLLNLKTITANEFYDGFVVAIVGWDERREADLGRRYTEFEARYRSPGSAELKSTVLGKKQFRYGFRSLNKSNARLVHDYLELLDEDMLVYFCFSSKAEYLVYRLFSSYQSTVGVNMDLMKYSLAKLVVQYRPQEVVEAFYGSPEELDSALRAFLERRIERNKANPVLKHSETEQCQAILAVMDGTRPLDRMEWEYYVPLEGFAYYLGQHHEVGDYELDIDREEKTAAVARELGFHAVREVDSVDCFGVRMADMLVGILGKLLKAMRAELSYQSKDDEVKKNLFGEKWFDLDDARLGLYKRLRQILLCFDRCWYKPYAGVYSDDLVVLIALLNYLDGFENAGQLLAKAGSHAETFNVFCCESLNQHFKRMGVGMPLTGVARSPEALFRSRLRVTDEPIVYNVVTVAFADDGAPMVVVRESGEDVAYALPDELAGWAAMLLAGGDATGLLFPGYVQFQIANGHFCADIL